LFGYGPARVDTLPPPPPPPPAYVYAATDERPRGKRETELCESASTPDWLYFGASVVLTVGAITLDNEVKYDSSIFVRQLGPSSVGFFWGLTLSGGYLSIPKCTMDYAGGYPPEGDVRVVWPMAVAFAVLAGITAPILVATENGVPSPSWTDGEREMRVGLASGFGVLGTLVPYLLPPRTWSAARELEHLRAGTTADGRGGFVSWSVRF
jgi:hypothetical protein